MSGWENADRKSAKNAYIDGLDASVEDGAAGAVAGAVAHLREDLAHDVAKVLHADHVGVQACVCVCFGVQKKKGRVEVRGRNVGNKQHLVCFFFFLS